MNFAIKTEKLSRIYKIRGGKKTEPRELVALQDVNLQVQPGELFGLLGPNGAGKTTLIKILTTLLAPTQGKAWVDGLDVEKEPQKVRTRINMVSGGENSGYGLLTVRENLWMFSQFYGLDSGEANQRIKRLLEIVGMGDRLNTKSSDLSTGLRQKMNIVRGFLTDPQVLFLDEPTLGLDVGAARDVRKFIRQWIDFDQSRTLLLTTHYMVEADELCDRVAIINQGRVLACDTPAKLKNDLQSDAIFRLEVSSLNGVGVQSMEALPGVKQLIHKEQDDRAVLEFI
jgi:ABC-2 type transport system ATP-binding protein